MLNTLSLAAFNANAVHIGQLSSFVSRIDTNGKNLEIIETVITLAHKLGMDITAEGVETKEQLAFLNKFKCEYGQGYFFSRPLNKLAVVALIMKNAQW
ncbi:EAL domain-containing protein [Nostoc sp.]|uniref:EAL domain-containing protein n=1 Tax=Nostoc sp. TaxID=1180 RepID=UPI002FF6A0B7